MVQLDHHGHMTRDGAITPDGYAVNTIEPASALHDPRIVDEKQKLPPQTMYHYLQTPPPDGLTLQTVTLRQIPMRTSAPWMSCAEIGKRLNIHNGAKGSATSSIHRRAKRLVLLRIENTIVTLFHSPMLRNKSLSPEAEEPDAYPRKKSL